MSRRKRETEAAYWDRLQAEELAHNRRACRTMWEKINDCTDVHDLKELLHEIVQRLDID